MNGGTIHSEYCMRKKRTSLQKISRSAMVSITAICAVAYIGHLRSDISVPFSRLNLCPQEIMRGLARFIKGRLNKIYLSSAMVSTRSRLCIPVSPPCEP